MDTRLRAHLDRDEARRAVIRVHLLVWGVTERDRTLALNLATWGDGRTAWQFACVSRHGGPACPFPTGDAATALATESGLYWAYAIYPAEEDDMTDFKVWQESSVGLIEPRGTLNGDCVPELRAALYQAMRLTRAPLIAIVDGKTTSVDQVAAAVLIIEHGRLKALHGTLAVVGARGPIALIVQDMRADDDVPIFADVAEALTELTIRRPPP